MLKHSSYCLYKRYVRQHKNDLSERHYFISRRKQSTGNNTEALKITKNKIIQRSFKRQDNKNFILSGMYKRHNGSRWCTSDFHVATRVTFLRLVHTSIFQITRRRQPQECNPNLKTDILLHGYIVSKKLNNILEIHPYVCIQLNITCAPRIAEKHEIRHYTNLVTLVFILSLNPHKISG